MWKTHFLSIIDTFINLRFTNVSSFLEKIEKNVPTEKPLPVKTTAPGDLETRLLHRFRTLTRIDTLTGDQVLRDLSLSSIKVLTLVKELKKEFVLNIADLLKYHHNI